MGLQIKWSNEGTALLVGKRFLVSHDDTAWNPEPLLETQLRRAKSGSLHRAAPQMQHDGVTALGKRGCRWTGLELG